MPEIPTTWVKVSGSGAIRRASPQAIVGFHEAD